MKYKSFLLLAVVVLVSGCASTQLNYNTLELGSTADKLLAQQVLHNIEKFIDSDTAIPAQITITSGTASTTNSLSPSFTSPLDNAVQTTVAATTRAFSFQGTRPAASASLSGSDTWAQNWGYSPITDAYQMRRLRALYRFAIDGDAEAFVHRYPLLYKSVTINRPQCVYDDAGQVKLKFEPGNPGSNGIDRQINLCATAYSSNSTFQVGATTISDNKLVPDEHYLRGPACIVCLRHGRYGKGRLTKNENLQAGWLRWVNLPGAGNLAQRPPAPGDQSMGVYGHHELFVAQGQGDKFVEFTMFVLAASTQIDATGASNSSLSASRSSGGGRPATQSIVDSQGNVSTVFPGN
jgi:hypothetical protein